MPWSVWLDLKRSWGRGCAVIPPFIELRKGNTVLCNGSSTTGALSLWTAAVRKCFLGKKKKKLRRKSHMLTARGKLFPYCFLWFVFHLLAFPPVSAGDTYGYWQTARAAGSLPHSPVMQPVTQWLVYQVTQAPHWDSAATKDWGGLQ